MLTLPFCIVGSGFVDSTAFAQRGGRGGGGMGGARPSMGHVGASGARPMNMNMSARPQMPASRPQMPQMPSTRPSFSNAGRPNMPSVSPNMSRPAPNFGSRPTSLPSQPNVPSIGNSRPSLGIGGPSNKLPQSMPNMGGLTRPAPGAGINQPSLPTTRPNFPTSNSRPNIKPPNAVPSTRPALSGNNLPQIPNQLPGVTNKLPGANNKLPDRPQAGFQRPTPPSIGGLNPRPLPGDLTPSTKPAPMPGIANRPGGGGAGIRPEFPNRPGGGGAGTRPEFPNRPGGGGAGTRPDFTNRPGFGGSGTLNQRPQPLPGVVRPGEGRPSIGGWKPGRPGGSVSLPGNIGSGGNWNGGNWGSGNLTINNNNNNFINNNFTNNNFNRPFWDRPSWGGNYGSGWGGGAWGSGWGVDPGFNWHNGWHDHCIHPHYNNWYNGCWTGYWGSSWYSPIIWGGIGWGLGTISNNYYNYSYVNPYYTSVQATPALAASVPYDYSQPIVVNNYISPEASADSNATGQPAITTTPQQQQSFSKFDSGLEQFKAGNYPKALSDFTESLKLNGGDPVVHEVRALTLFALGDYQSAAATLNSLLASAPGMDWTSMSSLYGNTSDYTTQLRKLEEYCKANPTNPSSAFVLAYHYLVIGEKDAAINALNAVVKNQPQDMTAKRMLDALQPPTDPSAAQAKAAAPLAGSSEPSTPTAEVAETPEVDLVGNWVAKPDKVSIELSITEDSKFSWKALEPGKPAVELKGELTTAPNGIVLETESSGSLAGTVNPQNKDQWEFLPPGAKKGSGLMFVRKNSL